MIFHVELVVEVGQCALAFKISLSYWICIDIVVCIDDVARLSKEYRRKLARTTGSKS